MNQTEDITTVEEFCKKIDEWYLDRANAINNAGGGYGRNLLDQHQMVVTVAALEADITFLLSAVHKLAKILDDKK